MCKYNKVYTDLVFFFCFNQSHLVRHTKWMQRTNNRTIIFGQSAQHIPVRVFIMKEDLELLIEEKWRKLDEFDTFISAIEKLPSPNKKNIALHQ